MCLHGRKARQPHGASVRPQSSIEGSSSRPSYSPDAITLVIGQVLWEHRFSGYSSGIVIGDSFSTSVLFCIFKAKAYWGLVAM